MPYEAQWLEDPFVLELVLIGEITEDDLHDIIDALMALMDTPLKARAVLMMDVSQVKKMPALNVFKAELDRFGDHYGGRRPGMAAVYGLNALTRYVFELLMKVARARFKAFDSREEAELFAWQVIEINQRADQDAAD